MMTKGFSVFLLVIGVHYICGAATRNVECPQIQGEGPTNLVFTHPDTGAALPGLYTLNKHEANETEIISYRKVHCHCKRFSCKCCIGLYAEWLARIKACISTRYAPEDSAVEIGLKFNEEEALSTSVSVEKPEPQCTKIPSSNGAEACVVIRRIEAVGNDMRACINLSVRKSSTQYFIMHFKCIEMGTGEHIKALSGHPTVVNPSSSNENKETELNQQANKDE